LQTRYFATYYKRLLQASLKIQCIKGLKLQIEKASPGKTREISAVRHLLCRLSRLEDLDVKFQNSNSTKEYFSNSNVILKYMKGLRGLKSLKVYLDCLDQRKKVLEKDIHSLVSILSNNHFLKRLFLSISISKGMTSHSIKKLTSSIQSLRSLIDLKVAFRMNYGKSQEALSIFKNSKYLLNLNSLSIRLSEYPFSL